MDIHPRQIDELREELGLGARALRKTKARSAYFAKRTGEDLEKRYYRGRHYVKKDGQVPQYILSGFIKLLTATFSALKSALKPADKANYATQ